MSDQDKSKTELLDEIAALRQRNAELESVEEEIQLLRGVLANATGQIIWATTPDHSRVILFNPLAEEFAGYKKEDFIDNPSHWFDIVHPDDKESLIASLETLFKEGRREIEYRIFRGDGSICWLSDPATLIHNSKGEVIALGGLASDITKHKEAEEFARLQRDLAVATNEATNLDDALEMCVDMVIDTSNAEPVGIYLVDSDQSLRLAAHDKKSKVFHDKITFFSSETPQAMLVQTGRPHYTQTVDTIDGIKEVAESADLKSHGTIPILYRNQAVAALTVGFKDITHIPETVRQRLETIASNLGGMIVRLEAEKKLRESEASMRAMFDAISEAAFLVTVNDHTVLAANKTAAQWNGTTVENFVGTCIDDYVPPEVAARRQNDIDKVIRTRSSIRSIESGFGMVFEGYMHPIFDESDEITALACFAKDVTEQHKAAEKIAVEQKLLRELFELQERERTLVSHEIHDGIVQDIVAAKMFLNAACVKARASNYEPPSEICKVEDFLETAISEARRLIRELKPLIVDDEGIVLSLEHLIAQDKRATDIDIDFRHDVTFDRLDPMLEGNIYRIVQESVRNAIRHSKASKIEITLIEGDGNVMVGVVDDGVGFNPDNISKDRFGVRGIRERARLFGGSACIESSANKGTHIYVQLPIELTGEILD